MKLLSTAEKVHARMVLRDLKRMLAFVLAILISPAPALAQVGTESHNADTVRIGRGTAVNKTIEIRNSSNSATNPKIRWNNTLGRLEFTNNGSLYKAIGSGSGGAGGVELLGNPGFEDGATVGWTNSGGTFTEVTAGSNLLFGDKSVTFDSSASGQYIQSDLYTIPEGLKGAACLAYVHHKGGDGTYFIKVLDEDGDVIVSTTGGKIYYIGGDTGATSVTAVPFTCPLTGSASLRLRVEASANASVIALDDAHLGSDNGQFQLSQAQQIVFAYRGTSDQSIGTTSATTLAFNFATMDTYSEVNTSTGVFTAKVGRRIEVSAGAFVQSMTSGEINRINVRKNGSTACFGISNSAASTGENGVGVVNCPIDVAVGDTVDVAITSVADSSYAVDGDSLTLGTYMTIREFPNSPQVGRRYNTIGWEVNATISGGNPSLGTVNQAAYVELINSSLTLTNNTGAANMIPAQIACTSTEESSGSTCSGAEGVGLSFVLPAPGQVEACATFGWEVVTGSSATNGVNVTFQLVETPNNAQTITQEGKKKLPATCQANSAAQQACAIPFEQCGTFSFTSAGKKTIRLMYEQLISGTPASSLIYGDQSSSVGQRDINFVIRPVTQTVPAPVLSGPFENVTSVTGAYTALPGDSIIRVATAGGAFTVGLPSAVGLTGKVLTFIKSDSSSNLVTIDGSGTELIGGVQSLKLHKQYEPERIVSNGTGWDYLTSAYRTEAAVINLASTCSITSQDGAWAASVTGGSGICTITFASGVFSAAPKCWLLGNDGFNIDTTIPGYAVRNASTSSVRIDASVMTENTNSSSEVVPATSGNVGIQCVGLK